MLCMATSIFRETIVHYYNEGQFPEMLQFLEDTWRTSHSSTSVTKGHGTNKTVVSNKARDIDNVRYHKVLDKNTAHTRSHKTDLERLPLLRCGARDNALLKRCNKVVTTYSMEENFENNVNSVNDNVDITTMRDINHDKYNDINNTTKNNSITNKNMNKTNNKNHCDTNNNYIENNRNKNTITNTNILNKTKTANRTYNYDYFDNKSTTNCRKTWQIRRTHQSKLIDTKDCYTNTIQMSAGDNRVYTPPTGAAWDSLVLWVCPHPTLLHTIAHQVREAGLCGVTSVGCGTGLLEALISACTGLRVTGLEVNRSWWSSKYSPPVFINHVYVDEVPESLSSDSDLENTSCKTGPSGQYIVPATDALMCCYFNDKDIFNNYVASYDGPLLIIIGSSGGLSHSDPAPLDYRRDMRWRLKGVLPLHECSGADVMAVYTRRQTYQLEPLRFETTFRQLRPIV